VLRVRAVGSFISSFGGVEREEEEKERWEMEEENKERTYPST